MKVTSLLLSLQLAFLMIPLPNCHSAPHTKLSIEIDSQHQPAPQRVRLQLPKRFCYLRKQSVKTPIRIVYVLPVEAGSETRWGDSFQECAKLNIADRYNAILVFPEFAQLPWYADHPTEKEIAQESFFVSSIVPEVDQHLELCERNIERYLLGFSKSGWGAFSLLLRHPNIFQKASAWDAPLMMDAPGKYGSGPIFGTPENFKNYHISELLTQRAKQFRQEARLISLGFDNFRNHHLQFHDLANRLEISHIHRDGPKRPHHWNSGWLPEAVDFLLADPAQ